jgi:CelD/BcsL family acetyltransferase involved in cellulose biosynthesis
MPYRSPRASRAVAPAFGPVTADVRARSARSPQEWDGLVRRLGGSGFQTFRWLSTVVPAIGQQFVPLVLLADGAEAGVLPVILRRSGMQTINCVPFPDAGPLVTPQHAGATLTYVRELERQSRISKATHCIAAAAPGPAPEWAATARSNGYTAASRTAWVVQLGLPLPELRARLASGRRAGLARASRRGIHVRPASVHEAGPLLSAWMDVTFARQGERAPYPREAVTAIAAAYEHGPARLAAACGPDGEPLAIMVTIGGSAVASGWTVQRHPDAPAAASSDAVATLYWDSIVWAKALGYTALDLGGSSTPGVANYKRGWGAEPHARLRLTRLGGLAIVATGLRRRSSG